MKRTKQNGITLIALVITIIVLLILAAVSIATLTGENGILTRTNEAKEETGQAAAKEKVEVEVLGSYDNNGNINIEKLNENLESVTGLTSGLSIEFLPAIVEVDGYEIMIEDNGDVEIIIRMLEYQKEYTKPYLPSSNFSQVPGTDLEKGLVITDGTNYWTWIEVPTNIYTNEEYNEGTQPVGANDCDAIERILNNYAGTLIDREGYEDIWYDGKRKTAEESTNLNDTTGCGLTYDRYSILKKTMLKSVYQNGGFWIGQYEAGTHEVRTSTSELTIPIVQQDAYPYNYITCSDAQIQASQINAGNYISSLMFGIQWDLVMKHLQTHGVTTDELTIRSTDWGNYLNATFNITRGAYSEDFGVSFIQVDGTYEKPEDSIVILTAGASTDKNVKMNIYDLAGNLFEWTLEKAKSDKGYTCTYRGGDCSRDGSVNPASYRSCDTILSQYNYCGFRSALY